LKAIVWSVCAIHTHILNLKQRIESFSRPGTKGIVYYTRISNRELKAVFWFWLCFLILIRISRRELKDLQSQSPSFSQNAQSIRNS